MVCPSLQHAAPTSYFFRNKGYWDRNNWDSGERGKDRSHCQPVTELTLPISLHGNKGHSKAFRNTASAVLHSNARWGDGEEGRAVISVSIFLLRTLSFSEMYFSKGRRRKPTSALFFYEETEEQGYTMCWRRGTGRK